MKRREKLLAAKIKRLAAGNRKLQKKIKELKKSPQQSGKETDATNISPREQTGETQTFQIPTRPPKDQGKILNLNKDFNFIITDLGKIDGLQLGQILNIFRNDTLIGKVRIENLYEEMSSAVVLKNMTKVKYLEPGDLVKALSLPLAS